VDDAHDARELLPPLSRLPRVARNQLALVGLTVILIASFALKLYNLGHLALRPLDESFHAVVAANLLEHPLTPTLIDRPFLPYDHRDWLGNHVWLHKGIVPLWQIALSYKLFGVETFGLRFPSALLGTLSVLLTYLIGRELLDRGAALVAAALHAFSPAMLMLVHGYAFSDHIDVALVFWVELGIWLVVRAMRTGGITYAALAGFAQGLAFLSKMYPALIVTGIALAAWLVPVMRLGRRDATRFAGRQFAALVVATIVTAAPWLIWTAARFPNEFRHEYWHALRHLGADVEGWGAPWDRLVFGYALAAFYVLYPAVIVATVLLPARAWRERDAKLWLVLAWALGVLIPFTLATSKTPSATAIGWPACYLLVGAAISRAARGDALLLGGWLVTTVLALFLRRHHFDVVGMGGDAGAIFRKNDWVLWHVLAAIAGGVGLRLASSRIPRAALGAAFILAAAGSVWLFGLWTERAFAVVARNDHDPAFVELGKFARAKLLPQSVLLIDEREKFERNTLMFRARRTVYAVTGDDWRAYAAEVVGNGGVPFVVSHRALPLRPVFFSRADGRTLYQVTPADLDRPTTTREAQ
jgi:4-amino-4-deoxy-L-arabinose transferase